MPKITAITVAAAIGVLGGISMVTGEHVTAQAKIQGSMPSILQMMSDARGLQPTPFVAP
jgi:hypothetical protein